jgi:glyoxylase-like metal-dependent hydrolase (beta-lactamase superfamily II)
MALENRTLRLGPLDNGVYLITDPATRETAVVDVGFEPERVIEVVEREGLAVRWLLGTHAHYDHVAGMRTVQQAVGGVYALHPLDRPLLDTVALQGPMFGFPPAEVPEVGLALADGMRIALGGETLEVLFTPGHAPGHVVFRHGDTLWGGDVLFRESVGRTDLPGGDWATLERSILTRLFPLGDAVRVLPGHGPATTIGHERVHNPFVGEAARR